GSVTLSIPLPVSAGRGYAPSLALNYSNRGGERAVWYRVGPQPKRYSSPHP
ncbi:hypothetical protein RVW18_004423, partial [Enterobacter bugandensis]|nr:hypothetical protein [Enterobacter bugandensis]